MSVPVAWLAWRYTPCTPPQDLLVETVCIVMPFALRGIPPHSTLQRLCDRICGGRPQATPLSIASRTSSTEVLTPSFWRMIDEVLATVL